MHTGIRTPRKMKTSFGEEDIQIIKDWTTDIGPRVVHRLDYGLGLEDDSGWNNKAGVPWWKFKTSSRDKFINEVGIAIEIGSRNENIENLKNIQVQNEAAFLHNISTEQPKLRAWNIPTSSTDKQEEIFAWILKQNIIAERQAFNAVIVGNLRKEAEALREKVRHLNQMAPKPKKAKNNQNSAQK